MDISRVIAVFFGGICCIHLSHQQDAGNTCMLSPEQGTCLARIIRHFYNSTTEKCEEFVYGGCGGNSNNFETLELCQVECTKKETSDNLCLLSPDSGPCTGAFQRFYYNRDTKFCQEFTYGGCGGNDNNFDTAEQCQQSCVSQEASDNPCQQKPETGQCKAMLWRFYYNAEVNTCGEFVYGGCGGNANNFREKHECEAKCLVGGTPGSAVSNSISVILFSLAIWVSSVKGLSISDSQNGGHQTPPPWKGVDGLIGGRDGTTLKDTKGWRQAEKV